ncbi:MAG: hypothetical protein U5P10_13570 [Spirochaetia bacterium]|nr:hypothetical protein [Spirochaetia bacterium]
MARKQAERAGDNVSYSRSVEGVHPIWRFFSGGVEGMQLENIPEVTEKFYAEMIKFIDREIFPKIARLEIMEKEGETT